jgi:hypothetical protein
VPSILSFNLLLFSIIFLFCSHLSIFASIILSLFILNVYLTLTFTPISLSNHSSSYSTYSGYYNIILPLLLFSLFHLSSIIFIQSASSVCHFSSLPLIFSLPAATFLVLCSPLLFPLYPLLSLKSWFSFPYPFPCFYFLLRFYLGIFQFWNSF